MENRNGQGIFLGVVGVATLVVAIIGATFAYFSAQIVGNQNVNAESYVFNSTLSVSEISKKASISDGSLIPLDTEKVTAAVTRTDNWCVDTDGYDACEIYKLVFDNQGSSKVTFKGVLTATTNEFGAGVLHVNELSGTQEGSWTAGTGNDDFALPAKDGTTATDGTGLNDVVVDAKSQTIVYLAVYVKNEDVAQNEMGKKFSGLLTYTSSTGQKLQANF